MAQCTHSVHTHAQRAYTRPPLPFLASLSPHQISLSSPVISVTGVRVVFGQTYSPAALKRQRWTRWPTPPVEPLRHPVVISKHMPKLLPCSLSCACLSTLVAVHEVPSFRHITVRIKSVRASCHNPCSSVSIADKNHPAITHE